MTSPLHTLTGRLTAPDVALPAWAQAGLYLALWDRHEGPESIIARTSVVGPRGVFRLELSDEATSRLAAVGPGEGQRGLVTVGWGEALDPALAILPWPEDGACREPVDLGWDGTVTLIGYVEQLHFQEVGGVPLAILELSGYPAPFTYRRLPPLPLPASGDRHGLHADRRLDDAREQVAYLLADAESPLTTAALDALVSSLRVVGVASLGVQEARWHAIVNVPLVLDALTLIGP